jgi:integrase
MPRPANYVASYRKHKPSGQAVVTLNSKDFYLGPYESDSSRREYDRLIAEWTANGRLITSSDGLVDRSINFVLNLFWDHVEKHYRHPDGLPTSEVNNFKLSIDPLKQLYGHTLAKSFGPLEFKAVRQTMIDKGLRRGVINQRMGRIRRAFRWAVENALVPPSVYHGLQAVRGLQRGRSEAVESTPVRPVPANFLRAVEPHVSKQVAAMVRLQELSGMRPGEVVAMRPCDIVRARKTWEYYPSSHKTEHMGHKRVIYLGPKAQKILKRWLRRAPEAYLFSPIEAEVARNGKRRKKRQTPMTPSQSSRKPKANPKRPRRDHYTVGSYRRAIQYGIEKANKDITDPAKEVPRWHPHRIRHSTATRLRKTFGIDGARVVLGHRSPQITETYAELDGARASRIMSRVG